MSLLAVFFVVAILGGLYWLAWGADDWPEE